MANRSVFHYPDIGVLGEDLVARWLQTTGWTILHQRWRCPWGEIDLVAKLDLSEEQDKGDKVESKIITTYDLRLTTSPLLAFVEVKTRKLGNWDAGGLLAITPHKQTRLWQAAEYFLTIYPDLAACQCRFDVALVQHRKLSLAQLRRSPPALVPPDFSSRSVQLGQAVAIAGYQLILQEYLPSAFG